MAVPRPHHLASRDALKAGLATANDVDTIVAECGDAYVMAREHHIGNPVDAWELFRMALNERRRRARKVAA